MKRIALIVLLYLLSGASLYAEDFSDRLARAEQGDMESQLVVAHRYQEGQGVPQDYAKAIYWYRKSAEQGHYLSQATLGVIYETGEVVTQDYAEAVRRQPI